MGPGAYSESPARMVVRMKTKASRRPSRGGRIPCGWEKLGVTTPHWPWAHTCLGNFDGWKEGLFGRGSGGGEISAPPPLGRPHSVTGARADISSITQAPFYPLTSLTPGPLGRTPACCPPTPSRTSIIVRITAAYDERDRQRGGSHEEALLRIAGVRASRPSAATNAHMAMAAVREGLGSVVINLLFIRIIAVLCARARDRLHLVILADRERRAVARLLALLGRPQKLLAAVVAVPVGPLVVPLGVAAVRGARLVAVVVLVVMVMGPRAGTPWWDVAPAAVAVAVLFGADC
ncbi:hypothetical protein F5883DRAFT_108477 [Diaporthe sp. PMI_573]|nr:hypothetical protein F5883DRAFT_108477 [Diaporthaceae sp. PMI_573]